MSVNGRFNNTDCLPVTGKDGKTQWIFKLEDLREVVPEDVYEAIEGFTEAAKDEAVDEFLENWEKEAEVAADGYYHSLELPERIWRMLLVKESLDWVKRRS